MNLIETGGKGDTEKEEMVKEEDVEIEARHPSLPAQVQAEAEVEIEKRRKESEEKKAEKEVKKEEERKVA